MDGNVIDGSLIDDGGGYISGSVSLEGVSKDNVDEYVGTLKSKGFEMKTEQDMSAFGMFMYELSDGKCTISITLTTGDNKVVIGLRKQK